MLSGDFADAAALIFLLALASVRRLIALVLNGWREQDPDGHLLDHPPSPSAPLHSHFTTFSISRSTLQPSWRVCPTRPAPESRTYHSLLESR